VIDHHQMSLHNVSIVNCFSVSILYRNQSPVNLTFGRLSFFRNTALTALTDSLIINGMARKKDPRGRKPLPPGQRRVLLGSITVKQETQSAGKRLAKELKLPGWGHVVDLAMAEYVEREESGKRLRDLFLHQMPQAEVR